MKKYILSLLILLIVSFAGTLFAQNNPQNTFTDEHINIFLQETGLDESYREKITQQDLENFFISPEIFSENNPVISDNAIATQEEINEPPFLLPQQVQPETLLGSASCFEYYKFGSVDANFRTNSQSLVNGQEVEFFGEIVNKNNYPLIDGKLYVKIFKQRTTEKNANGPDVIDQFVAIENITLKANEVRPMSFKWNVPAYIDSGDYTIATYFITEDKFNFLGLSFTDDIVGNTSNFSIVSDYDVTVRFDKESALVSKKPYFFAANPPRVDKENPIVVEVDIKNSTDIKESVEVVWYIYSWDAQAEDNLIETYTQMYEVDPSSSTKISTTITNNNYPVYYAIAELRYEDAKSFANIRFVRERIDRVRLNFPSVLKYPLSPEQTQTIFACVHNSGSSQIVQNNTLIMTLKDLKGKVIDEYTYTGPITGEMMAVKHEFEVFKKYSNFVLDTKLYTEGVLVDSSVKEYRCEELNPEYCNLESSVFAFQNILILLGFFIFIVIIFIFIKNKMSLRNIPTVMFGMLTLIFGFNLFVPIQTEAKSVTWTHTHTGPDWYYYWNRWSGSGWARGLADPVVSITYHTKVTNLDTGQVLQGGEELTEGTRLRFEIGPFGPTDIYWFGTGYSMDSPYGEWSNGPGSNISCDEKDYVNTITILTDASGNTISEGFELDTYIKAMTTISGYSEPTSQGNYTSMSNLLTNQPTDGSTQSTLDCGTALHLVFNQDNAHIRDCVVRNLEVGTSQTVVRPTFVFPRRFLQFYYRYYDNRTFSNLTPPEFPGCYGNNEAMRYFTGVGGYPYQNWIEVSRQEVPYEFTIKRAGENNPPTSPVIVGPLELISGSSWPGTFSFTSTDPDGDKIKYQVDWNGDGIVDTTNFSFITSGTTSSWTRSYSVFPSTLKARAIDEKGAMSDWSDHVITQKVSEVINFLKNDSTTEPALGTMTPQTFFFNVAQNLNLNQFVRPGYTFQGWSTTSWGSASLMDGASYTMAPRNTSLSLFAVWTANPLRTVSFNGNQSTGGSMANQSLREGQTIQLNQNQFQRVGHIFASWNTQANGSGTRYPNRGNFFMPVGFGSNITLFAQWLTNTIQCDTSRTEGQEVCLEQEEFEYTCSPDGVWDLIPTRQSCVPTPILSCEATPGLVFIEKGQSQSNEEVIFSYDSENQPNGTIFAWYDNNTNRLSTETTYSMSQIPADGILSTWTIPVKIRATYSGGGTQEAFCPVTVVNRNFEPAEPLVSNYFFSPRIANNGSCPLVLTVSDVKTCRFTSRSGDIRNFTATEGNIVINKNINLNIGTWSLSCINLDDQTINFDRTISCISNPSIREI